MKKTSTIFLSSLFLILTLNLSAQNPVSGTVTSAEDGSALIGVTVQVKGTSKGSVTDADGKYAIDAKKDDALIFSFVGYKNLEAVVTGGEMNMILALDAKIIQEFVKTALGINKAKSSLGYSVQEVKGEDLIKAREPNSVNSLVGKVAGLTVGVSPELLARPSISLRGNSDVLFVVDGIPINSDTWNISSDDIETYTVLKGPNAAALYGFRGRNGAIMITTKRGTEDKKRGFSIGFNSSTMIDNGFNAIPKVQDLYGPGEYGKYYFFDGLGTDPNSNDSDYDIWGPKFEGQLIPQYDSPVDPVTGKRQGTPWVARGTDNLKRFLRPGVLSTNNLVFGSTGDKHDIRVSMTQTYQQGIVPNTQLNISNISIASGYNFTPKLRFEANINYNRQYTPNIPDVVYGPNSLIYNMDVWGGADWNVDDMRNYWQKGKEGVQQIYAEYTRYNNPYFMAYEWLRGHYKTDVYGYTALKYKFDDHFELTGKTAVTTYNILRTEKFPYSAGVYGRDERLGDYREDRRDLFENNTDLALNIKERIANDWSVSGLVGANLRIFNYNSSYGTTDYLNVPGIYNFSNSLRALKLYNFNSDMRVLSGYYSADFSYKTFATLSTTGRVDKLSTLPPSNNTYFYPSVSAGIVPTEFLHFPEAISFVKLRASYANVKSGLTQSTIGVPGFPLSYGSQYTSSYDGPSYANTVAYSTPIVYNGQTAAYYSSSLADPNIKPASNSSTEAGLEMRFLKNRVGFDLTYFVSNNGPKIFNLPISDASGYSSALVNGITTQTKGVEISVNGRPLQMKDFTWDVVANWSTYTERLKEIYPQDPTITTYNTYIKVGDRVDAWYGSAFARTPDGSIINDANGKPIRLPQKQLLGYTNPDWVFGINNKFHYKDFTFSFQFDGRVGGVILDYVRKKTFQGGRNIETVQGAMGVAREADYRDNTVGHYLGDGVVVSNGEKITYDPATGLINDYAKLQFSPNTTKANLQDWLSRVYGTDEASRMDRTFVKLREITLGYTIPKKWLGNSFIRTATFSLVGRNLLYFAKYTDVDVDQYTNGEISSDLQTPTLKRYGFNINLTF